MTHELTTLDRQPSALELAGQAANHAAAKHVFDDYRARKSPNTLRAQDSDLALFADFLASVSSMASRSISAGDFAADPAAWRGITWGLVEAFREWLLREGKAIATVNRALSTVKKYAALAFKAGAIDTTEHALIRTVSGYARKEANHVNEKRQESGLPTRVGRKKAEHTKISHRHAKQLKREQPDTPQGRRDALLMCLLLDHGLRCGEVARLKVGDFKGSIGEVTFYRPKVDKAQTHRLSADTRRALKAWFDSGDCPLAADAPLLRGSDNHTKQLTEAGMSERAITKRVRTLGKRVGIEGLSAHDCRHYWATWAARSGTDPFALQEAGGWNSLAMPRRYVEAARIANEGVKLSEDLGED